MARRKRKRGVARHKRAGVRAKRRRAGKLKKRITGETTVYVGELHWRDNDSFVKVVALNKATVAKKIDEAVTEAAERAYDGEEYDSVEAAENDIMTSGVHSFSLEDIVGDRELAEAKRELEGLGYYYAETY